MTALRAAFYAAMLDRACAWWLRRRGWIAMEYMDSPERTGEQP
jgi:hypothetical protein